MSRIQEFSITPADHALLAAVANEVSPEENRQFRRLLPAVAAEARALAGHWDFGSPCYVVDRLIEDARAFPKGAEARNRTRLRQAAVARLALGFFRPDDRLPSSILKLYPAFLRSACDLPPRSRQRHLRRRLLRQGCPLCAGPDDPVWSAPVRSQRRRGTEADRARSRGDAVFALDRRVFCIEGLGPLVQQPHRSESDQGVHARRLDGEFREDCGTAGAQSAVRGVAGVAWFYDPALVRVSPHLAYIGETLQRSGAFRVTMKTQEHDIANALARSLRRKKLHERGEYSPACYLVAWPRRALLEWAARLKIDPSVAFGSPAPADERRTRNRSVS